MAKLLFLFIFFINSCVLLRNPNTPSFSSSERLKKAGYEFVQSFEAPHPLTVLPKNSRTLDNSGLIWEHFLLPKVENTIISDIDFLVGYQKNNTLKERPTEGSCTLTLTQQEPEKSKPYTLFTAPKEAHRALYFIIEYHKLQIIAVGSFDSEGKSRCPLQDSLTYKVSTEFGGTRQETIFDGKQTEIKVTVSHPGFLYIIPDAKKGIKPGSILRLGRKETEDTFENALTSIPELLSGDLFLSISGQNDDLDIDERMVTTILVGATPFKVSLYPGQYVAAILPPKSYTPCIVEAHIAADQTSEIQCPQKTSSAEQSLDISKKTLLNLEATPISGALLEDATFQEWLRYRQGQLILQPSKSTGKYHIYIPDNELLNKLTENSFFGPYGYDEKDTEYNFYSFKPDSPENLNNEIFIYEPHTIPVMSSNYKNTTAQEFTFAAANFFNLPATQDFRLQNQINLATNGTVLQWLNPQWLNSNLLKPKLLQQTYRFKVTVPPFNRTEFVDIMINGKLHKRILLPRKSYKETEEFQFEEFILNEKDFQIGLFAWGRSFLPELLYGQKQLIPAALLRTVCVDFNDNNRCDETLEK